MSRVTGDEMVAARREEIGLPVEVDVCPNDWRVRGYVRSSHSMFHPALHECTRDRDHAGRCRCACGSTTARYLKR